MSQLKVLKVLIVTAHVDLPESYIFEGLKRHGVTLEILCDPSSPHQERLRSAGISITHFTAKSRFSFSAIRALRKLFRRGEYSIVHFFSNRALSNGLIAALGLPLKTVAYRGTVGHLNKLDPTSWFTYLSPRLDSIVCVSEAVRSYLLELGLPKEKVITIYKGHDLAWYETTPANRSAEQIPDDAFVVCCAANMRPVKGVQYLLEAFKSLPESYPIHLLLIGEVRDERVAHHLKDLSASPKLHHTGFRKDVGALIASSDLFVMPSVAREGLPKAVIEAMALGVPVIVTNVGGLPELVLHDKNGIVIPTRDANALQQAILRLFEDAPLRERLGAEGKATITGRFHVSRSIELALAHYRSLVSVQVETQTVSN